MQKYVHVRPDVPLQPTKKKHTVRWVVLGVVALFIVSSYAAEDAPAEKPADQSEADTRIADAIGAPPVAPDIQIPASPVVGAMSQDAVNEFCTAYFTIGDYDLAVQAFKVGYDQPDPSAEEVVDELLTHC